MFRQNMINRRRRSHNHIVTAVRRGVWRTVPQPLSLSRTSAAPTRRPSGRRVARFRVWTNKRTTSRVSASAGRYTAARVWHRCTRCIHYNIIRVVCTVYCIRCQQARGQGWFPRRKLVEKVHQVMFINLSVFV